VLKALETIKQAGVWLELVVLIVPTLNDGDDEIRDMARWVTATLGADVPVHFTRFHPVYRLRNLPRTPVSTLERCREVARAEGLHFVYLGNVPGHPAENTSCPGCNQVLIERSGMSVAENRLVGGKCPRCGRAVPGVWA
jgi:pyruvate formate lyase activating enzyme